MRFQNIHAHFDDFEFTAGGTFELARRATGREFSGQMVVCTDGAAGHHRLTRSQTAAVREQEQRAAAEIARIDLRCLCYPDGHRPREGCMVAGPKLMAAMWKAIRDFRPDYLFCPPIPSNTVVGVHVDHLVVAESLRRTAFLINVPHTFTPEYPEEDGHAEYLRTPVILNVFDCYMFDNEGFDLAVDVSEAFELIVEESWCHQSQIKEWLPWINGDPGLAPKNFSEWRNVLRQRFLAANRSAGVTSDRMYEYFTLTGWGSRPTLDQLLTDLPGIDPDVSRLDRLEKKISRMT